MSVELYEDVVLAYKAFKTSKEFEEWQMKEKPNINNIAPMALNMGVEESISARRTHRSAKAKINCGVFVIYFKPINKKEGE